MIQIKPVVFPLTLGTANQLGVAINANVGVLGSTISYRLFDDSTTPIKSLANGYFQISEEDFATHGSDKDWVLNYVVMQLGITLI